MYRPFALVFSLTLFLSILEMEEKRPATYKLIPRDEIVFHDPRLVGTPLTRVVKERGSTPGRYDVIMKYQYVLSPFLRLTTRMCGSMWE